MSDLREVQILAFLNQIDETLPWEDYRWDFVSVEPYGISINTAGNVSLRIPIDKSNYDDFIISISNSAHKLCLVPNQKVWDTILSRVKSEPVAFDIETKHNKIYSGDNKIVGFSIAFLTGEAYYCPINFWCTPEESEHNEKMMITILLTACEFILQGGFFDMSFLHHFYELDLSKVNYIHDSIAGAHVSTGAGLRNYDLGSIASHFVDAPPWKDGPKEWLAANIRKVKDRTYDKIPPHVMFTYARKDAYYTAKVHSAEMKIISTEGLNTIYRIVMDRIMQLCLEMSVQGLHTDRFTIDFLEEKFIEKANESEKTLFEILNSRVKKEDGTNEDFSFINLNSSKQMGIVLYDILGLPIMGRTAKSNAPQTGTKELAVLSTFDPPLFASFFTFKKWKKYLGYLKNYVANSGQNSTDFTSDDFYICHSYFSAWGTDTGRTSSSKINAQNIAVESGLKSAFICPDRAKIISDIYHRLVDMGMSTGLGGATIVKNIDLSKLEKESDEEFDLNEEEISDATSLDGKKVRKKKDKLQ